MKNTLPSEWPQLPILDVVSELSDKLKNNHVVLEAPPGSGKTTLAPLTLLNAAEFSDKKIIMLEPRRPAARMAAARMAELLGEKVGQRVGYQIRMERRISHETQIEVLTEGLLVRRIQDDPELSDVGLVIFDEFHERSLQADLGLALCLDICDALRDDLRILLMSASMQDDLAELLNAERVSSQGQQYPVSVSYLNKALLKHEVEAVVPGLIKQAVKDTEGDVLVFLPGRGEINRIHKKIQDQFASDIHIVELFGDMPGEAQDKVIRPQKERTHRRVILTTDIAETSLTIDGVTAVVDSGLTRKPKFSANTGLSNLETRWISQASALQRTGRAGRLEAGKAYRAWSELRHRGLEERIAPEILDADLAPLVLDMAAWGVNEANDLKWLDLPPKGHWDQATALLKELELLDQNGHITNLGRQANRLPVHPRMAVMLMRSAKTDLEQSVSDMVALLSDRDPVFDHDLVRSPDTEWRLQAIKRFREDKIVEQGFDRRRLVYLSQLSKQIKGYYKMLPSLDNNLDSVGSVLAAAYPDRIAKQQKQGRYLLSSGRAVILNEGEALARAPMLVVPSLDSGAKHATAWLAVEFSEDEFEFHYSSHISTKKQLRWDEAKQAIVAREIKQYRQLVLEERPTKIEKSEDLVPVWIDYLNRNGLSVFFDHKTSLQLAIRIKLAAYLDDSADWPDITDESLINDVDLMSGWLADIKTLKELEKVSLTDIYRFRLGWDREQLLNEILPTSFETPAGSTRPIHYDLEQGASTEVALQEVLGISVTPSFLNGKLPLTMRLLSPARRPIQVTKDLASFWAGAYEEVKKEMKGRYPKHYWPDDPANAMATTKVKKRM